MSAALLLSANAVSHWPQGGARALPGAHGLPPDLPAAVAAALWRADQLGTPVAATLPSGFDALDAELPGGGWPCHSLCEILSPQSGILEWRLLGPLLRRQSAAGLAVVLVAPPKPPHPPGLRHEGLDEQHLVWVQAHTPSERLWATEQLIRSQACGVLIAWLPQVRPEQIRRLQVLAAQNPAPVLICRPSSALHEASAAPLRLLAQVGPDWSLRVDIAKRKGPPLDRTLCLASVPGGLSAILTPRLRQPSRLLPSRDTPREVLPHVVDSPVAAGQPQPH
jgi:protein ImuA